jgi:NAD(P)H-hydrate repair Nnr-like enzyme with NAD(P)H-hydrate dehydratase domain
MPDIPGMRDILNSLRERREGMTLIADAGAMYAAKAAGLAQEIDIFTPDAGEMAYLADPKATHPAYVEHLLFKLDASEVVTLIKKAYETGNTPEILLVKGPVDYVVEKGEVVETINEPSISAMEAIGGTGDSLTGILSALIYGGYEKIDACIKAARINRVAGKLAQPDPATSISHIIDKIPDALKERNSRGHFWLIGCCRPGVLSCDTPTGLWYLYRLPYERPGKLDCCSYIPDIRSKSRGSHSDTWWPRLL